MSKRWKIIAAVAAAIVLLLVLFMSLQKEPVAAVQLKPQDVTATLTVTGEVQGDITVNFSPPVSARILSVAVDEGDAIRRGQLLVQLDTAQARAQLSEAGARAVQAGQSLRQLEVGTREEELALWQARYREAGQQISQAQANLAQAQSRATTDQRNAERLHSLYQQNVASAQEYENAQTQADVSRQDVQRLQAGIAAARAQRAQISAQLAEAERGPTREQIGEAAAAHQAAVATIQGAEARLRDYQIFSSINGIVTQRLQDPGDLGTPGQPVLRAVDPGTLQIFCSVEESDLPKIHVGDPAYVILDALPDVPLNATVRRIGSQVNPENGAAEVRVVLSPDAWSKLGGVHFLPGMTADVSIVTGRLRNALVLPATAVRTENGYPMVYRFDGNRLQKTPIRAERISLENFRVISGLQPGDWVAAMASEKMAGKRGVRPVPQEQMPKPAAPPSGGGMMGG